MIPILKRVTFSLVILLSFCYNITKAQCHIDDWMALKSLFENTNGNNWADNTGWQEVIGNLPTTNCNLGNLYGVELDNQGRVDHVNLSFNQLNGNIPFELANLANLKYLWLQSNQLSGFIPTVFGSLINLEMLSLSDNQLNGNLPDELGSLTNLIGLSLSRNQFSVSGIITTNNYLPIGKNQQVEYRANRVTMNEGFSVKAGADFKVRSEGCN